MLQSADQLSDGAWVTSAATIGVVTRTSLTQAVPGRSRQHWRHRATSQSGPECITGQGVKSEWNQQAGKMFRAVLMMLSLVALSVAQRRPPPGVNNIFLSIILFYTR